MFFPDFHPIRVSEEAVCIDLLRQNPVFTSRLCRTASGAREAAGGLGAVRRGRGGGQPGGPGRLSIPAGPSTQRWPRLQRRGRVAPF